MRCKKCGTELRNDDEFCYSCGRRTTVFQRLFASKAVIGSGIAIIVVIIATILTWMIMSGRLDVAALKTKVKNIQTKKETVVVGDKEDKNVTGAVATATENGTPTPEPSAAGTTGEDNKTVSGTAVAGDSGAATGTAVTVALGDVTDTEKVQMKKLTARMKPFLAYCASYYENNRHPFKWDDVSATTMAMYNLYFLDKTVKYGVPYKTIQKKTKKEVADLFGDNAKYNFTYGGYFPDYVFVKSGSTVVYNAVSIRGKTYSMKVDKILHYKEGKYRVIVSAGLVSETNKADKGYVQKYTVYVEKDDEAKYGYVIRKVKLYEKKDGKL